MPKLTADYRHCLPQHFAEYMASYDQTRNGVTLTVVMEDAVMEFPDGFWWNGANYIPNFRSTDRGSLVHDILCELGHRNNWGDHYRLLADREIYCLVRADGSRMGAEAVYCAVRGYQKTEVPVVRQILGLAGGAVGLLRGLFAQPRPWPCGEACDPNARFDYDTDDSERPKRPKRPRRGPPGGGRRP